MPYQKTQWINNSEPSINAQNLNKIEQGIYDNSVAVETQAGLLDGHTVRSDVPSGAVFTDTTYTAGANVQINGTTISATDTIYDDTALRGRVTTVEGLLDGHSVAKNVPADAVFTDTVYDDTELSGRVTQTESDISDLQEATEHLSDGDTVYPYASEIEIEDALGVNAKDVKVKITAVQSGSGIPSPQNVRPIIGFDECEIDRVGKNLLPMTLAGIKSANTVGTWNGNVYSSVGATVEVLTDANLNVIGIKVTSTGALTNQLQFYCDATQVLDSSYNDLVLNGCPSGGSSSTYRLLCVESGSSKGTDYGSGVTISGVTSASVQIRINSGYTIPSGGLTFYPMIRKPTESDSFEPYKGKKYTINLNGTIYGGELDVTTGIIVMTVDRASVDLGTLTWQYNEANAIFTSSGIQSSAVPNDTEGMCEVYKFTLRDGMADQSVAINVNKTICVKDSRYNLSTIQDFVASINGVKLCYTLATPLTIQLTPQQIQLLEGYNYLTANTGDIQVTTTDIQGAIGQADALIEANTQAIREINSFDDSIFGTVENGTTASKAYAKDDYFVKDKKMCKALTSIAEGATFTLDTNYAAYTIADILKAIEQL